jgi:hypothetical protein
VPLHVVENWYRTVHAYMMMMHFYTAVLVLRVLAYDAAAFSLHQQSQHCWQV